MHTVTYTPRALVIPAHARRVLGHWNVHEPFRSSGRGGGVGRINYPRQCRIEGSLTRFGTAMVTWDIEHGSHEYCCVWGQDLAHEHVMSNSRVSVMSDISRLRLGSGPSA